MKNTLLTLFSLLFVLADPGLLLAESDPHHCSVFTVSKGDQVFFGGNDDWINDDQYYWVDPGDSTRYGMIWIGYPDKKYVAKPANGVIMSAGKNG